MYSLPYFKEQDPEVVKQFVRDNPFALLTGCDAMHQPVVTQIPVFIDERDGKIFLSGHMMKNTDHHKAFMQNDNVLAVFTSPHTYVSASWYTNPQQGSTWNYISVHARGHIGFLDERSLVNILERTTTHFEKSTESPGSFKNIPADYIDKMTKAIVGFEIAVDSLENVFKLSQNRDEQSYRNIIGKLERGDAGAKYIAEEMKKRAPGINQ